MYRVLPLLSAAEIAECKRIAAAAPFVDGRITNPHNTAKQNEQLHEAQAYQRSSQLLLQAFGRSEEFREFAFPVLIAPPLITRYKPGMRYGAHADAAFIQLQGGMIRSDLSCTVFLNDPGEYDGGALHIRLGEAAAGRSHRLPVGHSAPGRARDSGRAAGGDHLHPEPHPRPVPPRPAVRAERGGRA
jgi:PKHD-type hydroxylase